MASLVALVLGTASGMVIALLDELIRWGEISGASASYAPIFFFIFLIFGLLGAGLAVVTATAVRNKSRSKKSVELEALSGGAVAGVIFVLVLYSWGGMATAGHMAITGLPVAVFTWLALRKSGAMAARRARSRGPIDF